MLITVVNGVYRPTYNWRSPHCSEIGVIFTNRSIPIPIFYAFTGSTICSLRGDSGGLMHEEEFEDGASMNAEEEEAGAGPFLIKGPLHTWSAKGQDL